MPHFFDQPNNSDEGSIARNDAEIYAITEYLYSSNGDKENNNNSSEFIGNAENGEKLFNVVGCSGCHVVEEENISISNFDTHYDMHLSNYGYEVDSTGQNYEKMDFN